MLQAISPSCLHSRTTVLVGPTVRLSRFDQQRQSLCLASPIFSTARPLFSTQGRPGGVGAVGDQEPTTTSRSQEQQVSTPDDPQTSTTGGQKDLLSQPAARKGKRQADSTDWVASQLTRRFGIAGGLAWLAILTFGVVSEQIKTRLEYSAEKEGTKVATEAREVVLASGVKYRDVKVGGGAGVQRGFLVLLHLKISAHGKVIEDTKAGGKPIVFPYGSRPFQGGICMGVEEALETMRAGGVRRVVVPPEAGFGAAGAVLRPTLHVPEKQGIIPPNATLEYELEVVRVSIPPS